MSIHTRLEFHFQKQKGNQERKKLSACLEGGIGVGILAGDLGLMVVW